MNFGTIVHVCKLLLSPESIPPGWESIPGLIMFTNTGSGKKEKIVSSSQAENNIIGSILCSAAVQ
jgi:hypothetical protein